MNRLLLDLSEAWITGPGVVGGKGYNLSRLSHFGFDVPRGVVLTTHVYRQWANQSPLRERIVELTSITAERASNAETVGEIAALREMMFQCELPAEAKADLESWWKAETASDNTWAVRSSAAAEDGDRASFAGIHASTLQVRGFDGLLAAIIDCYASLWTPQALAYRRRFGISDDEVACAVVVCEMVLGPDGQPPVASGVAFTCDPATGRRDLVVVNAAPGLGEQLVQGQVNPQQFHLTDSNDGYQVARRDDAGGDSLLSQDRLAELALLCHRVMGALGEGQQPQDVEWVFDGTRFWLVQARPVTRLPEWTFPGARGQIVYWSNANFKDVMPGVVTTLTWGMTLSVVGEILFSSLKTIGYPIPDGMEVARRFQGRAYFNLTAIQWAFYDALGISPAEVNRTIGGQQPAIDVPKPNLRQLGDALKRTLNRVRFLRGLWHFDRDTTARLPLVHEAVRAARSVDVRQMSNPQLLTYLRHWRQFGAQTQPLLTQAAGYGGAWLTQLQDLLRIRLGKPADSLVSQLLAGSGDLSSAEQGYRLIDLAEVLRNDGPARAWFEDGLCDPFDWRRLDPASPFRQGMQRYLDEFGHRGVNEVEFAQPRWVEDPSYLIEQIRFYLANPPSRDMRESATRVREQAESDLRGATFFLRSIVRWLLSKTRRGLALREATKSAVVATMEPLRRIFLEVGRRLESWEKLDHADDVFHLSPRDIEAFLLGNWQGSGARQLVADRQKQRELWQQANPPDVVTLDPQKPMAATDRPDVALETNGGCHLSGIAAAPGRAEGTARLLTSPDQASRLGTGDILVAPSTDPGWTPLFLRAGAIVMETGGYLSHGAIVAREFGLPAVINVPDVMRLIEDGERLYVDGDTGEIIRLDRTKDVTDSLVSVPADRPGKIHAAGGHRRESSVNVRSRVD